MCRDIKAQLFMASLIPIRLVDASGKPNFLRSGSVIKSTGRDEKAEEEGGEEMWNVLSKNEDLRSELGSYIPASQHINIGTTHTYTQTCKYTHTLVYIHTHKLTYVKYIRTHNRIYIHTHTYFHTKTNIHPNTHSNTHPDTHPNTHLYIRTCFR